MRHQRLAHLEGREELQQKITEWERWQWEIQRAYPGTRADWGRLREQAERLAREPDWPRARGRRDKSATPEDVRRYLRHLQTALQHHPDMVKEVLQELSEEKEALPRARQQLPPRRHSFHPADPQAQPYLQALDHQVETLREQGEAEEACQLAEERVRVAPTPESRLLLGELLQMTGRGAQALEQYRRVPYRNARRYFHSAALHHREGRLEEAFQDILCGLTRDRRVGDGVRHVVQGHLPWWHESRKYWERYGHLWSAEASRFLYAIYSQGAVRTRLTQAGHERVLRRSLLPDFAHRRVWETVLEEISPPL